MNNIAAALAKIDAASTAPVAAEVVVGTRFTKTDARGYTNTDGSKGVHGYTLLCEVVAMTGAGFKYEVVEVVAESGRPSFGSTPTSGSMAGFGFESGVNAGRIQIVSAR